MANISLLEMGKTKKRNVRETILSTLSKEFPLNIKKIYNKVRKEYRLEVTYQAVFKIINGMLEDNILEKSDKEYKLNIAWIKDLENELEIIKKNYLEDTTSKNHFQERVNRFITELGPKIKEYIGKDELCIVGITGPGVYFSTALWKYLTREGIKANYSELNKVSLTNKTPIKFNQEEFKNKKVLLVDSSIFGGTLYRLSMERMNSLRKKFKILDVKFACDEDGKGLADFSVSRT